jgi:hypothetical protein
MFEFGCRQKIIVALEAKRFSAFDQQSFRG